MLAITAPHGQPHASVDRGAKGQTRVGLGFHRFALRASAPTRERVIFQQVPWWYPASSHLPLRQKGGSHVASHEAS
jgi:hypothetical protein